MTNSHIVNVSQSSKHLIRVNFTQSVWELVIFFIIKSENFVKSIWHVVHHKIQKNFILFGFLGEKIIVNFDAIWMV